MLSNTENPNLIAKQSIHYNRYQKHHTFSKTDWIDKERKEAHKNDYDSETGLYSFTYFKEIDKLLNAALNRDYSVFNSENKNYRTHLAQNIGYFEIFKILDHEYFIESEIDEEDGKLTLSVYNFEYNIKWLTLLSDLKQNYKLEIPLDVEKEIIDNKPDEIENSNLLELAKYIHNIFRYSIEYHHRPFFEKPYSKRETLNTLSFLWSWKNYIDDSIRENRNDVILKLNELFLNISTYEFMLIRDYTINSLDWFILKTSKIGLQWGYSPYMEKIDSLVKAIRKNHSDKKIMLKNEIKKDFKPKKKSSSKSKEKFNQTQIAIAYFFRKGKAITTDNYSEILEEHSTTLSDKILQKRIKTISELTEIKATKTASTKHLKNIEAAKRLLMVVKDENAIKSLDTVLSTFRSNYISFY